MNKKSIFVDIVVVYFVYTRAIETCSDPTPAGLCCNNTCANCTAAHPEHCLSCNHGFFMRDHGNHSICTNWCAPGGYRNYSSGHCSECSDMFDWCKDCETVDRPYMEIIEKAISPACETWCGDQRPQPFDNYLNATLMCRFQAEPPSDDAGACKPGSVLISGCSCCVQSCPAGLTLSDDICIVSYRQKIRQKIADFTNKHCPLNAIYCWSIAVGAVSLVVLVLISLCCCCCYKCCRCKKLDKVRAMELQTRRKLSADDGHPSKLRSIRRIEESQMNRSHDDQAPEPPPLRPENSIKMNKTVDYPTQVTDYLEPFSSHPPLGDEHQERYTPPQHYQAPTHNELNAKAINPTNSFKNKLSSDDDNDDTEYLIPVETNIQGRRDISPNEQRCDIDNMVPDFPPPPPPNGQEGAIASREQRNAAASALAQCTPQSTQYQQQKQHQPQQQQQRRQGNQPDQHILKGNQQEQRIRGVDSSGANWVLTLQRQMPSGDVDYLHTIADLPVMNLGGGMIPLQDMGFGGAQHPQGNPSKLAPPHSDTQPMSHSYIEVCNRDLNDIDDYEDAYVAPQEGHQQQWQDKPERRTDKPNDMATFKNKSNILESKQDSGDDDNYEIFEEDYNDARTLPRRKNESSC